MRRSEAKYILKKFTQIQTFRNLGNKIFCSRLYKKDRKKFLDKLDIKLVTLRTKNFWTTIKPFLSHNIQNLLNKITIVEGMWGHSF